MESGIPELSLVEVAVSVIRQDLLQLSDDIRVL
jgi:hypothetical protein